jgi:ectoine hydroxylase
VFRRLVRHPTLLQPALQILQSEVYVYQFKINFKVAMGGDTWKWHQDFIFWNKEDGLPEPRVMNMSVFLDEVTEFNGPMMFVPGSHKLGLIEPDALAVADERSNNVEGADWTSHVSVDLKYSLKRELLADLVARNGLVAPKGPAGSLLLFDSNLFHASASNLSPFNRTVIIVTYNTTANQPRLGNERPEFLVSRQSTPLEMLSADCILGCETSTLGVAIK